MMNAVPGSNQRPLYLSHLAFLSRTTRAFTKLRPVYFGLLAFLTGMGPVAFGQEQTPAPHQGGAALEEVIVTARKREEALQDVPVAVTAFSAEALEIQGIANTRDLQEATPGLVFSEM